MKFKKYFFENFSADTPFDRNNPRYVLSLDGTDSVLDKIIANKPYTLTINDFSDMEMVNALLHIEVLQQKKGKLGMAVPFFVEKDAMLLQELSKKAARNIAAELLARKEQLIRIVKRIENGFPVERNLYHILCAHIFDGLMFDYLEENGLVTTSCVHRSGLDYLVVIYEDASSLNEYGDMLLCSYNRLTMNGKGFVSFGDSNGSRKDFYRYMRRKELNLLSEDERAYVNCSTEALIENFDRMAEGKQIDPGYMRIYEQFGYCQNGKIVVPLYDSCSFDAANSLYEFVLNAAKDKISDALALIQQEKRLSAVAHEVCTQDIANELYHLIFGEVNEFLAASGLVAAPPYIPGEGRYFKSFER